MVSPSFDDYKPDDIDTSVVHTYLDINVFICIFFFQHKWIDIQSAVSELNNSQCWTPQVICNVDQMLRRSWQTKDYKLVFFASLLSTQHSGERAKTGWLGIRIMCTSGSTFLSANYFFNELARQFQLRVLVKYNEHLIIISLEINLFSPFLLEALNIILFYTSFYRNWIK